MADEADRAAPRIEAYVTDALGVAARAVAAMPKGEPGECSGCGNESLRLVDGYCAPCRDRYARFIR